MYKHQSDISQTSVLSGEGSEGRTQVQTKSRLQVKKKKKIKKTTEHKVSKESQKEKKHTHKST